MHTSTIKSVTLTGVTVDGDEFTVTSESLKGALFELHLLEQRAREVRALFDMPVSAQPVQAAFLDLEAPIAPIKATPATAARNHEARMRAEQEGLIGRSRLAYTSEAPHDGQSTRPHLTVPPMTRDMATGNVEPVL